MMIWLQCILACRFVSQFTYLSVSIKIKVMALSHGYVSDPAMAASSRGLQPIKEAAPKRSLNLAEYKKMKGLI